MKPIDERYSIKDVSLMLKTEDENLLFGQFLDDFYRTKTPEDKQRLIQDEPVYDSDFDIFISLLAGTAEILAHDYKISVPTWTQSEKYFLKLPYYAYGTKSNGFRRFLRDTTPNEYSKRNLYVGNTILRRC